jgi:hypothetical protein
MEEDSPKRTMSAESLHPRNPDNRVTEQISAGVRALKWRGKREPLMRPSRKATTPVPSLTHSKLRMPLRKMQNCGFCSDTQLALTVNTLCRPMRTTAD